MKTRWCILLLGVFLLSNYINLLKVDLNAYQRSLDDRVRAFFNYVLNLSTVIFLQDLKELAPTKNQEPEYKDNLKQYIVKSNDPKFVVALDKKITKEISKDQKTVIYVKNAKNKELLEILFRYQPFVYEYFPLAEGTVETYFKSVRDDEVQAITQDNVQDRQSLIRELESIDVPVGSLPEKTVMQEDIGHKILRSEFGLGPYQPHWKIALANFKTGEQIDQEMNKKLAERILFDPKYRGYLNLKINAEIMDQDNIEEFKAFMKYLL